MTETKNTFDSSEWTGDIRTLINYTWPGRFHCIVRNEPVFFVYVTVWFFKRRHHYSNREPQT